MGADYSFYVKTIETHGRAFLPLNISAVGSVDHHWFINMKLRIKIKFWYLICLENTSTFRKIEQKKSD